MQGHPFRSISAAYNVITMKLSLPSLFKRSKRGSDSSAAAAANRKEDQQKWASFNDETTVSTSEGSQQKERRDSKQRRGSKSKRQISKSMSNQKPLFLTEEQIQASLKTLPKAASTDTSDHITEEDLQKRIATIEAWFKLFNSGEYDQSAQYITDDCAFHFGEPKTTNLALDLRWEDMLEVLVNIAKSFPDMKFQYTNIRHVHGVIILQGWQFSGTHTKDPFGFGPFDPIPAEGKFVQNDVEELYFYFQPNNHEKFCRQSVYTNGEMTGPQGLYTQLGGFPML